MKYLACLIGLLFIPACTLGPDYVKQTPPSEQTYTQEKDLSNFGDQKINPNKSLSANWWEEFESPKLNEVVNYGLQHSFYLQALHKNLEQAIDTLDAETAQLWPQVDLHADAGRQKYGASFLGPLDIVIPPFTYYEIGPSLTYLIDIFGATRRAIENQQALADYQAYAYQTAYLSVTGKIVSTAITIGTLNSEIEAVQALVREDKQNVKYIETAYKLGAATQNDVLSAKNQLLADEAILPALKLDLDQSNNELNILIGKSPAEWKPPHFTLKDFKLPSDLPLSLPSKLVHDRPDILAAEAVLHAANAAVGVATANLYPNIVITGNYLQEALTPKNLFLASSGAWKYIGSVTAPVFNGGLLQAQKRAAIRAYEGSLLNYQDVVVKSFVQVNDVLHALKINEEAEQLSKRALSNTKKSLDLAQKNLNAGGIGKLGVLSSERQYRQAQVIYTKVHGQRYQDTVQLYLALGGSVNSI